MPPAIDTPEEVAAMLGALFGLLVVVGTGVAGVIAAMVAAWRAKIKPLLAGTQQAAQIAAHEVQNNSGHSLRDAVDKIADTLDRMERTTNTRLGDLRADLRQHTDSNDRAHSELFRRVHALESPNPQERIHHD